MAQLMAQALQLQRTVWLLAKKAGGSVTIDEREMNPLWEIRYKREDGTPTAVTICAEQMPEPTEQQLTMLAQRLIGKKSALHLEALACGLDGYPAAYMMARLAPLVICQDGLWSQVK